VPQWIDDRVSLTQVLEAMQASPMHVLDTEFERVRTFWPKLALVQVALPARNVLIDPLAFADLGDLGRVLGNGRPWLMHSASEDLVALKPLTEHAPTALFDTQIAAALLGLGSSLAYQKLVQSELGVSLAKSETRSDWLQRPLSAEQIDYAADDVIHLQALCDRLGDRLDRLGRMDWLWQDGQRQIAAGYELLPSANPHHEFRAAYKLPLAAQVRLVAVLEWRERTARSTDRPRSWVLDNATAIDIAQNPPRSGPELLGKLANCRAFPRRQVGEVIDLLASAEAGAPFQPAPAPLDRETENALRQAREQIDALAASLALESSTLCSRRLLEARARLGTWPPDCTRWRQQLLEPLVQATLGASSPTQNP